MQLTRLTLHVPFPLRLLRALAFLVICHLSPLHAAEFRGAWVATVYNLDWPSKPGLSSGEQKAQLRALLDRAASLKLNGFLNV